MAATAAAARLTEAHRLAQARLGALTVSQVLATWPLLDPAAIDATVDRWLTATIPIVSAQNRASAALAGDYMRAFRLLELGDARLTPSLEVMGERQIAGNLLAVGPAALRAGAGRGEAIGTLTSTTGNKVARDAMRLALNGGRDTTLATVDSDPASLGWARATSGKPCAFCAMLASRGPVYKSEATAGFHAHGSCSCTAEPVYSRDAQWPPGAREFRRQYDAAVRSARSDGTLRRGTSNDLLNAFRRSFSP